MTFTFDFLIRKQSSMSPGPANLEAQVHIRPNLVQLAPIVTKILYSPGFFGSLPTVNLTFDRLTRKSN